MVNIGDETRAANLMPELSPYAEVALLCRALFREGYDDHIAGHIASVQPDGTFLVNPFELPWDEVRASDIMRIDADGEVLEGERWTASRALRMHLALHRRRHDVTVSVHNHSRYGTLWADLQRIPPIHDQTSALIDHDLALYDEWGGLVGEWESAEKIADAMGLAPALLLAHHGVFVAGRGVADTYLRCMALEWRCRQAWMLEAVGGAAPMPREKSDVLAERIERVGYYALWEGMVRREIRQDPTVLD
ncbi:MAG: class II aldolase/adducin family protein [Acidimicrobiales bacterium]|nr:class II aldolase/adducin family protein [Acidimicrobiales bacterium]